MPLLFPLALFLVLCIVMLVNLSHTKPPSSTDTVEALCDAILRNDKKTQSDLCTLSPIPTPIIHAVGEIASHHEEIAKKYSTEIVKTWDSASCTFEVVAVALMHSDESIHFTCCWVVNQWNIISISLESPRARVD